LEFLCGKVGDNMDIASLALFAGALCLNAGTPGPSIAALVARVLTRGAASVLPFVAAMWIGEALWLTAAVFGLSYVAKTFYWAFAFLKYAGVAYLLWLAYKMWTSAGDASGKSLPEADSTLALFGSGMAVTLGNPKLMGFYLALLPSLIDVANISAGAWAALVTVMLCVLAPVDLAWIFAASYAGRWLRDARSVRIANRVSAAAMGGAAVAIAAK
jgi:threonine/homoserine/homoserine lactone efflux protein